MFESIFFLTVAILTIITVTVWPVMFMAKVVGAEKTGFGWSLLALIAEWVLWVALIIAAALLFRLAGNMDIVDLEELRKMDPKKLGTRLDAYSALFFIPGFILYLTVSASVFRWILVTSFLKGVAICIGSYIVRIVLVIILAVIAVILS